jgi:hypothetical protein
MTGPPSRAVVTTIGAGNGRAVGQNVTGPRDFSDAVERRYAGSGTTATGQPARSIIA